MSGLNFANRGFPAATLTELRAVNSRLDAALAEVERLKAELAATRSNFRALVELGNARDLRDKEDES